MRLQWAKVALLEDSEQMQEIGFFFFARLHHWGGGSLMSTLLNGLKQHYSLFLEVLQGCGQGLDQVFLLCQLSSSVICRPRNSINQSRSGWFVDSSLTIMAFLVLESRANQSRCQLLWFLLLKKLVPCTDVHLIVIIITFDNILLCKFDVVILVGLLIIFDLCVCEGLFMTSVLILVVVYLRYPCLHVSLLQKGTCINHVIFLLSSWAELFFFFMASDHVVILLVP